MAVVTPFTKAFATGLYKEQTQPLDFLVTLCEPDLVSWVRGKATKNVGRMMQKPTFEF